MLKMKTIELTVGAFVLAGILSLLMLALKVSGLSDFLRGDVGYHVTAEFSNIGGLKPRAKVSVAGVVVGRVTHIELDPKTFNATVTMSIDPAEIGEIPADSQARIMTAGLLGDNYISLIPGFNENEFLKEGSQIPIESTQPAISIEGLVSKFLGAKASEPEDNSRDVGASTNISAGTSMSNNPIKADPTIKTDPSSATKNSKNSKNGKQTTQTQQDFNDVEPKATIESNQDDMTSPKDKDKNRDAKKANSKTDNKDKSGNKSDNQNHGAQTKPEKYHKIKPNQDSDT